MRQTIETTLLINKHRDEYGESPDIVVSAPGSLRLLGEHLPAPSSTLIAFPLAQRIGIAVSRRSDSSVRFFAADLNERKRIAMSSLKFRREDRWANLVKIGMDSYLGAESGAKGYNITIYGTIPQGLGLGSASALRCASAKAFALLTGNDDSVETFSRRMVDADSTYFDKQTRLSHYMAVLSFQKRSIVYIDVLEKKYEAFPSLFASYKLMLCDSKVPRFSTDAELKQRAANCEAALEIMRSASAKLLRDFYPSDMEEYMGQMPERMRRQCLFTVEEFERVREARSALKTGDSAALFRLIAKSESGLRNYYELSCPEIDWLIKRASETNGFMASRIIGKGFGGCTFNVARKDAIAEYTLKLEEYERIFGFKPAVLEISVGTGIIAR